MLPNAQPQSVTLSYTGILRTYPIPNGVTEVTIQAVGAGGGGDSTTIDGGSPHGGGSGASIQGTFALPAGTTTLSVLVGGRGLDGAPDPNSGGGGGGGASVVWVGNGFGALTTSSLLVAAGGGGGAGGGSSGEDASTGTSGVNGLAENGLPGGTGGSAGDGGDFGVPSAGGGGGGVFSDGRTGSNSSGGGGIAIVDGGAGGGGGIGFMGTGIGGGNGGFGGGGGGAGSAGGGGGGGGYSGGGSGSGGGALGNGAGGGGGGSYNGGTNQVDTAGVGLGDGSVTITLASTATQLAFMQQPSSTATVGQPFSIQPQVAVEDASGNTITSDNSTVTLSVGTGSTGSGNLTCTGGLSQAAVNGAASFTGCQFDAAGTYTIHATDGTLTPADSNPITVACRVDPNDVQLFADGRLSRDHKPTAMVANFTPTDANGMPTGLAAAETACGVTRFNFQQDIVAWPPPSDLFPANPAAAGWPANIPIIEPSPQGPFPDPPFGGYTYNVAGTINRYPYYWQDNDTWLQTHGVLVNGSNYPIETASTLLFEDNPSDPCLPGGTARDCVGSIGGGSVLKFTTKLVGISGVGVNRTTIDTGISWTWESNFNGTSGGVVATSNY